MVPTPGATPLVLSPRGLHLLYNAMQEHPTSAVVQQSAGTVMLGMISCGAGMRRVRQGGRAVALLRRAKAAHPGVTEIAKGCDLLLTCLTSVSDCSLEFFCGEKAVE